jgi:two-component system, chemotaxis family, protein-glutamate methylesterase/glutaminase
VLRPELVVIGCSLGGLEAIQGLLGALPPSMPAMVIVQHRLAGDEDRLTRLLRGHSRMPVIEPDDKTPITPGHVYIAPADYHLLVELGWFSLSVDPPVKHARPSIDVLFDTAARAYGARVIGVVLTGASDDGADGAKMIRDRGGTIIVQDPATAMSPIAPKSAIARAGADKVRTLDELPGTLTTLCGVRPRERGNTRPP